ncbi:MAG: ATP-binding cassette domain-containing protein, partial [Actinobacteria bacterium]|nr:ATP-binding cassette domain-containing protein [Actinomycetota bacterium]
MNGHTLTCENLTIGYETALGGPLNFTVPPGSVLAVVGPSGCGKSTLLSTIAGVIPAHSGRVLIDGVDVTQMPTHTRKVAMVFQEPLLFPTMTVRDNVAYGPRRSGASASDARGTAEELLSWVDL